MGKKNKKYEAPKVMRLDDRDLGRGICNLGSAANGSNVGRDCSIGNDAGRNCDCDGNSPGVYCSAYGNSQ